jgi:hypothetical protein
MFTRRTVVPLALALAGCGSNQPEIPSELLARGGCDAPDYPSGPYGSEAGDTVQNFCFQGFRSPEVGDQGPLQQLAFADFHDPAGEHYELLLVNSAAIWCSACQAEHQSLPARYAELAPRGLGLLSALFQDADGDPAVRDDLDVWIETFEPNFPMVLDPDYQLGVYASAETAPLNLVIDARSMRVERKFIGDQAAVLWPYIEELLASR